MKPVALIEAHLRNSSTRGSLGYDPFAGSGSTLLAAYRLGRNCAGLELDPKYADVCIRRLQDFSGQAATLFGDGRTFAEIAQARRVR